jgi:hypothetical protein
MKPSNRPAASLLLWLAVLGADVVPVPASADLSGGQADAPKVGDQTAQRSIHDLLKRVNDRNIRFGRYTPDRHVPSDRRVFVDAPPAAVTLVSLGRLEVLDALVEALKDKRRAWAAQVMLSKLTRREGNMVEMYSTDWRGWYRDFGDSAYSSWRKWLDENRASLRWDAAKRVFLAVPDGRESNPP